MADADTSSSRLAFREETAFGEAIPATPTLQLLRVTKHNLAHKNLTLESQELRGDRMLDDRLLVGQQVTGGFSFEFSGDTFDKFLEAILGGTFDVGTGVLKNGIAPGRSFQFEDQALDISQFIYFRGWSPNELNLDIASRQMVTGDINGMGTVGAINSATAATTTVAKTVTPVMAAGFGVSAILVNGAAIGIGVRGIKLGIRGNLRERDVVDSLVTRKHGRGDIAISGSISAYFANAALWNLFKNNTALSFAFTISDNTTGGKAYDFLLPRIKLSDDTPEVPGKNADRPENISWSAYADPTEGAEIKITKRTLP